MFGHKKSENSLSNSDITTLIGENCTVEGNITAAAYIKIDGKVLGNLNIEGGLILGENAYIKGNIKSNEVITYGRVDGDVQSNSLQLKSSAAILGNIETQTLQIEPGAVYQGTVYMQEKNLPQLLASA